MNKKKLPLQLRYCISVVAMLAGVSPANALEALTAGEVTQVVNQAVAEAQAQGVAAVISVVDRAGNRLAIFQMDGALTSAVVTSGTGSGGLEGATVPADAAAISKAITPAYFSTQGNAFSTRTAGQLIQEHFNPGEFNQPAGPLYGVQFSQLSCSDVVATSGGAAGPKSAPLGLAADAGGLPLFKNGEVVGGIGVMSDGIYGIDLSVSDNDKDVDELVALAGTIGFEAPENIRADRIVADGRQLRYTNATTSDLLSIKPSGSSEGGTEAGEEEDAPATAGGIFTVPVSGGVVFGTGPSGIVPDNGVIYPESPAETLAGRFNPTSGTDGPGALTAAEVRQILAEGLVIASKSRAQLRRPSRGPRFSIAITDTNGAILGIVRSPDAPLSSTDIAVQKARTAALFSRPDAGALISGAGLGGYIGRAQAFITPTAFADGTAYTGRALQNLARPYYPDGIDGNPPGPFSPPASAASPFNIGLQLDAVAGRILSSGGGCGAIPQFANGIQLRVSSVPIYRGDQLIGGIGASGDGAEQEDLVTFGAVDAAAQILGTINNADPAIRADQLSPQGARLRYVNCPQAPFLSSDAQDACSGK
jgi:uncharacterized protein GlcG (DUF336 family)